MYKKLLSNSLIFAIGNFSSRFLNILLVPLYTYYFTTAEYGTVDLVTTTISLMLPIVTLNVYEAVLRFTMDEEADNRSVFTNSIFILIFTLILALSATLLVSQFVTIDPLLLKSLAVILCVQSIQTVFSQYARGKGKIKAYALNGIITTFIAGVSNIILIVYLHMGIQGYFISIIISNLFSILYFAKVIDIRGSFDFKSRDKALTKKLLLYSLPLIPNSIMWWLTNASNRYFILFFLGASANGLFAVANKIPSLISMVNSIFFQAWQLSAIEEYNSDEKETFYSSVFNYFSSVLFLSTACILAVIRPALGFLVEETYFDSWKLVPFLLLSVVYSSFSSFLGTNYIASKKTTGVFTSSIVGAIVSVLLNSLLIPWIGIIGSGISSMVSFFVIWLIRLYDTKRFVALKVDWPLFLTNNVLLSLQIVVLFVSNNTIVQGILQFVLTVALFFINRSLIIKVYDVVRQRKEKRN